MSDRGRVVAGAAFIGAAVLAALVPLPPARVEAVYALRTYPALQAAISGMSNAVPVPLFDVALLATLAGVAIAGVSAARRSWRMGTPRPLLRTAASVLVLAAAAYLWFLFVWGLNYRRPPIESFLRDVDPSRVTPLAIRELAERAVAEANTLYARAHHQGFPTADAVPAALLAAFHDVEHELGRPRPTTPTRPKRPLTAPYMRAVGVSGMLAPLFLETYLNPDLTGPERPYVLAHEWAHLAGFAPEDEASFVGALAALRADPASQYSAWLSLVFEAAAALPPPERRDVIAALADGPRRDQEAIERRLRQRVPALDRAGWAAYDRAIKSQGATDGVAGYRRVVELLLSTNAVARGGVLR